MKDKEKRINEMSRDMCFVNSCNTKSCYAVNCETTWLAEKLIDLNYQKVDKDSVVITRAEKEKLLHKMYEQGVEEFADFIKSQMGIERDYMGIKYKQGIFSDYDIDDLVKQFNNRDKED